MNFKNFISRIFLHFDLITISSCSGYQYFVYTRDIYFFVSHKQNKKYTVLLRRWQH